MRYTYEIILEDDSIPLHICTFERPEYERTKARVNEWLSGLVTD